MAETLRYYESFPDFSVMRKDRDSAYPDELELVPLRPLVHNTSHAERTRIMTAVLEAVASLKTRGTAEQILIGIFERNSNEQTILLSRWEDSLLRTFQHLPPDADIDKEVATALAPLSAYVQRFYHEHKRHIEQQALNRGVQPRELAPADFLGRITTPQGVISPLKYIRARDRAFPLQQEKGVYEKGDQHAFYLNERLDAGDAVDLVEVIYHQSSAGMGIREVRLVQIASSDIHVQDKIEQVRQKHPRLVGEWEGRLERFNEMYFPELKFPDRAAEDTYFDEQLLLFAETLETMSESEDQNKRTKKFEKLVNRIGMAYGLPTQQLPLEARARIGSRVFYDFLITAVRNDFFIHEIADAISEELKHIQKNSDRGYAVRLYIDHLQELVDHDAVTYSPQVAEQVRNVTDRIRAEFPNLDWRGSYPQTVSIPKFRSVVAVADKKTFYNQEIPVSGKPGKYLVHRIH